jgi:hypothetical protein
MSDSGSSGGGGTTTLITIGQNIVTALNSLASAFKGAPTSSNLIAVASPTNANAAAAGVAVGQFYRDISDPAHVYVRTV